VHLLFIKLVLLFLSLFFFEFFRPNLFTLSFLAQLDLSFISHLLPNHFNLNHLLYLPALALLYFL